jgi:hypothetical protein
VTSPLRDDHPYTELLSRRGSGVSTFVFGVEDLGAAMERAGTHGVGAATEPFDALTIGHNRDRFERYDTCRLETFMDLNIRLAQCEPKSVDS